jgi:hypothetical protein
MDRDDIVLWGEKYLWDIKYFVVAVIKYVFYMKPGATGNI